MEINLREQLKAYENKTKQQEEQGASLLLLNQELKNEK